MHFRRLRLHGFKSFVEPTDLEIPSGLTGIVGPNGCGKSNLVEALRWVMGENSPKRMRGSEMDDVIFAGTATRPSRNLAEVLIELDNTDRQATAEYNKEDTVQVTRHIERGEGSDYRINGKPVRQRDVQLLFADQATGAHANNLVGQGQIDALIRAKPEDRRAILEEASGTAGLHARRHEAELKLKAAEQNLQRVDDVLKAYDTQLRSLKQQVRQASRYRNLAEHIRKTEATILLGRWQQAEAQAETSQIALTNIQTLVQELFHLVTTEETARTEAAAVLPDLRKNEAAQATVVQRLKLSLERLDTEAERLAKEVDHAQKRLTEVLADHNREVTQHSDSQDALTRLANELIQLDVNLKAIAAKLPEAESGVNTMIKQVDRLDLELNQKLQEVAHIEATRQALHKEKTTLDQQKMSLTSRQQGYETERSSLLAAMSARSDLSFAMSLVEASEKELTRRQEQVEHIGQVGTTLEAEMATMRQTLRDRETVRAQLQAEENAILNLLKLDESSSARIIDLIDVHTGLEQALSQALGEALSATLNPDTDMYWRDLPPLISPPNWPEGVLPLKDFVKAPSPLARTLDFIGIVDEAMRGDRLASTLEVGQILVSRDGYAWRWDGLTVRPQAKTSSVIRLQQKNRLSSLQNELSSAEKAYELTAQQTAQLETRFSEHQSQVREAREALNAAINALKDARQTLAQEERETTSLAARLRSVDEALAQIQGDLDGLDERSRIVEDELIALKGSDELNSTITELRLVLSEQRRSLSEKQAERDYLARDDAQVRNRMEIIHNDQNAWQSRQENAIRQITELLERKGALEVQISELAVRPSQLIAERSKLMTELSEAESRHRTAGDALIEAEQKVGLLETQLKKSEERLSTAREDKVRAEATVKAAADQFESLRERVREKLDATPEKLRELTELKENDALPDPTELEQVLARYLRERENLGAVNLRAETEAETLELEMTKLQNEKNDLESAIAKLRQGIGTLNREAKERLTAAFSSVNERFQVLFKRLFNGGRAYLQMMDHEDPMQSGLEIFASPPGKKMQVLSLLSGGERTLTALALLFAVFQTNPSPICVLDEAEAALDESNIERFCNLVTDIAAETGTRFLIITHQRLTMAKMDRLYGVTMGEKGVSQLVSVDLAGAVALRDGSKVTKPESLVEAALNDVIAAE